MARSLLTPQRAFPILLVATLVAAILPGKALGWTRTLGEVVRIVLTPFADPGNRFGHWLRPPPKPGDVTIDDELARHLQSEVAAFERLYLAEQAKVESLTRQLEQLQKVPPEFMSAAVRPVMARIGPRSPDSPLGTVVLSRGSRDGVTSGTVAVYDGVYLVGRITDDVTTVNSTLLPLANPDTGLLDASVLPADRKNRRPVSLPDAPRIQLRPDGHGMLITEADSTAVINPGDEVVLLDPTWPASAQAMVIGTVATVERDEMKPLRNRVVVKPTYQVAQLAFVMLRIEVEEGGRGSSTGEVTTP